MNSPLLKAFQEWLFLLIALVLVCAALFGFFALIVGWVVNGSFAGALALAKFELMAALFSPVGVIPVYGNYLHFSLLEHTDAFQDVLDAGHLPWSYRIFGIIWGTIGSMCAPALWFRLQEAVSESPGCVSLSLGLFVWIAGIAVSAYFFCTF